MSESSRLERLIVEAFRADAPASAPASLLPGLLDRTRVEPQRRRFAVLHGGLGSSRPTRLLLAVAVAAGIGGAAIVGAGLQNRAVQIVPAPPPPSSLGPDASPQSSIASPKPNASGLPGAHVPIAFGPLAAGTYRLPFVPSLDITVPDGWAALTASTDADEAALTPVARYRADDASGRSQVWLLRPTHLFDPTCGHGPASFPPARKLSTADILSWLGHHPQLRLARVEPVVLGELAGTRVEVTYAVTCQDNPRAAISFMDGLGLTAGGTAVLYLFEVDGACLEIEVSDLPFDAEVRPILETLRLGP